MGQAFTQFEVENHCGVANVMEKCTINWGQNGTGLIVEDLGGIERGDLESNGDIAGIGLLVSFAIPSALIIGAAFPIWLEQFDYVRTTFAKKFTKFGEPNKDAHTKLLRDSVYDLFESAMVAMSDYQIIFAAAVLLHFVLIGKCQLTMYHFNVGLNLMTIALANAMITLVFMKKFWKTPLSSMSRLVVYGLLLFYQGKILWTINKLTTEQGMVEARPPKQRRNSLFLLPAMCFLDPDVLRSVRKQVYEPSESSTARTHVIGDITSEQRWIAELVLWVLMVVFFAIVLGYRIFNLYRAVQNQCSSKHTNIKAMKDTCPAYCSLKEEELPEPPSRRVKVIGFGICTVTSVVCVTASFYRLFHVFHVREWVLASGWMKDLEDLGNPETHLASYGQVAALCAMAGFVVLTFDKIPWRAAEELDY